MLRKKSLASSITMALAISPVIAAFYRWGGALTKASDTDRIWSIAIAVVLVTVIHEPIRSFTANIVEKSFYRHDIILRERVQEFASMAVSILDLDILFIKRLTGSGKSWALAG